MVLLTKCLISTCLLLSLEAFAKPQEIKFPTKKIRINKLVLNVEVAQTPEQQERGLMYREKLAPNTGMLFVFPGESYRSFWMKNTYIDLSIGYFDKNRRLQEVIDMKGTTVMQTHYPSYPSAKPAMYALEVPQGWFRKHGVKNGDMFNWD